MKSFKNLFKKALKIFLKVLNEIYLKNKNKVFIEGSPTAESSAVSVANYIAEHYDLDIVYVVSDPKIRVDNLLNKKIQLIHKYSGSSISFQYIKNFISSKYIFYTHGTFIQNSLSKQITTNIWHGITYKKVGVLVGAKPFKVNCTVGTSEKTKEIFSEIFGIEKDDVFVSGYPRNDYLVNSDRNSILETIDPQWLNKKIIFWLPTFRKNKFNEDQVDGSDVENPFYIENFKVDAFDNLLNELNAICLLKPHPNSPAYKMNSTTENIHIIDDAWISNLEITLYEFMSVTDLLISDVSSVMLDYLFLDNPIICMSSDLEEYEKSRGFYFDNIEDWIPGPIIENQEDLFQYLKNTVSNESDNFAEKRARLKKTFFEHHDGNSTKRIVEHILNDIYMRSS